MPTSWVGGRTEHLYTAEKDCPEWLLNSWTLPSLLTTRTEVSAWKPPAFKTRPEQPRPWVRERAGRQQISLSLPLPSSLPKNNNNILKIGAARELKGRNKSALPSSSHWLPAPCKKLSHAPPVGGAVPGLAQRPRINR